MEEFRVALKVYLPTHTAKLVCMKSEAVIFLGINVQTQVFIRGCSTRTTDCSIRVFCCHNSFHCHPI